MGPQKKIENSLFDPSHDVRRKTKAISPPSRCHIVLGTECFLRKFLYFFVCAVHGIAFLPHFLAFSSPSLATKLFLLTFLEDQSTIIRIPSMKFLRLCNAASQVLLSNFFLFVSESSG